MAKYDYLKETHDQKIFRITKTGIGTNLYRLKMIKMYPDNHDKNACERAKEGLRVAMFWYHKMLREKPELRSPKQLNLFKEIK